MELAPGFASAWFALGEAREALGDRAGARAAFAQAAAPIRRTVMARRCGLRGSAAPTRRRRCSHGYVRAVFDQYAPRFDRALAELSTISAPEMLSRRRVAQTGTHALRHACSISAAAPGSPARRSGRMSTGWSASICRPKMIEQARRKGIYDRLEVGDIVAFLDEQAGASAHLVIAADVFVYFADFADLRRGGARAAAGGLFAFTVETHDGEGVDRRRQAALCACARVMYGARWRQAGLDLRLNSTARSTRKEKRVPVPGLLVLARRDRRRAMIRLAR